MKVGPGLKARLAPGKTVALKQQVYLHVLFVLIRV